MVSRGMICLGPKWSANIVKCAEAAWNYRSGGVVHLNHRCGVCVWGGGVCACVCLFVFVFCLYVCLLLFCVLFCGFLFFVLDFVFVLVLFLF